MGLNNEIFKIMAKAKDMPVVSTSQAQEVPNNKSMVSGVVSPRKRARQLQTSSRLNNQQTLLGS
jgi:hypothetical protein